MDTNEDKVLFKDEVFQVVGCAIEVLNTLGHGLVEKSCTRHGCLYSVAWDL